jgi:hypothetical protein
METKSFRVLSIDAWAEGEDNWAWNAWYSVGSIDASELESAEKAVGLVAWFVEHGYVNAKALTQCEIVDDGYNYVLAIEETGEPMYAIEYGAEQ